MNHLPQAWGRPRDDVYGPYDASYLHHSGPIQHTQAPIVTGTSVVAAKFKDGVVIAADNLASYGSLARFRDVKRLLPFAGKAIVGVGGDVSDMQFLSRWLTSLEIRESEEAHSHYPAASTTSNDDGSGDARKEDGAADDDGDAAAAAAVVRDAVRLNAQNLHKYLGRFMYRRRSDFNPLWNHVLVAGLDGAGRPFLSSVDLLGTTFAAPTLATGFGAHLAQPILRRLVDDEAGVARVDRAAAEAAVRECMKVLFYRDARSLDRYSLGVITRDGVELSFDEKLEEQSWAFAEGIRGYGTQTQ